MQDKYEALAELLKDEENAKEVFGKSPEEAQVNLKARGLDFTVEELKELAEKAVAGADGELDENSLDDVAGGIVVTAAVAVGAGLAALWGWRKRHKR